MTKRPHLTAPIVRPKRILVFCETNTSYGRGLLEGLYQYSLDRNWTLSFEQRGRDGRSFDLKGLRADAIVSRTYYHSLYPKLQNLGLPIVELLGWAEPEYNPTVTMDEKGVAKLVAEHFLALGLKRFAYYGLEDSPIFYARRDRYVEYLISCGYPCEVYPAPPADKEYFFPRWREKYRQKLTKWLKGLPKPIALFAVIDQCGQTILEICKDEGIRVPQDVALVAVGNDDWLCRLLRPSLSSVDGDSFRIGQIAAQILERRMNGEPTSSETIYVPPRYLAARRSSDFYVVGDEDVEKALSYIRECACQHIGIKDVADAVDMSERSLYRGFAKYVGRTPQEEIRRIQISRAQQLLRETNLSVASIGRRCGFSSDIYFIKAFRREVGISPNAFRIQNRRQINQYE